MKIELVEMNDENREECFSLKVAEDQAKYIDSNEASWGAAQENAEVARPFAIYADGKMVGFTMFAFDEEYEDPNDRYWLWHKAGFRETGEMNDEEIVLLLDLV